MRRELLLIVVEGEAAPLGGQYWEVGRAILGLPHAKPYIALKEPHRYIPPLADYEDASMKDMLYSFIVERILQRHGVSEEDYKALLHQLASRARSP